MPDDHDEHLRQHDELLRRLAAMLAVQYETNQSYDAIIQELRAFNRHQVAITAEVHTTLARVETLLARMLPTGENAKEG